MNQLPLVAVGRCLICSNKLLHADLANLSRSRVAFCWAQTKDDILAALRWVPVEEVRPEEDHQDAVSEVHNILFLYFLLA